MTPSKAKPQGKKQSAPAKAVKAKRAPIAPAPKPLPKLKAQQLTPSQVAKQQTQQHQKIAQHLHKELTKQQPHQLFGPQPLTVGAKPVTPIEPLNNSLDDRDKDELIMHSRSEYPFKTKSQIKSASSVRNRGCAS